MKGKMKKLIITLLIASLSCVCFTGCTSGSPTSSVSSVNKSAGDTSSVDSANPGFSEDVEYEAASGEANADGTANSGGTAKTETKQDSTNRITNDKLIYNCSLAIDTLDYDASVKSIRDLIKKYNAFLEKENETNDASYESYYYYDEQKKGKKHHTYTATVRVPSKDYNSFLDETGSIGEVRNKSANVENISQQYYDLKAQLEVLETKYKRYLEMLKKATTTNDILQIENSITVVETQINQIKTQLNRYDNDVAYSFINITIKEVEKIEDEEQRGTVSNAFVDSWEKFADVIHGLFILFLYFLPYLLVLAVILAIILIATRPARKRAKIAREERLKAMAQAPKQQPNQAPQQPGQTPPQQSNQTPPQQ